MESSYLITKNDKKKLQKIQKRQKKTKENKISVLYIENYGFAQTLFEDAHKIYYALCDKHLEKSTPSVSRR